jgi:hypothetical protein
MKNTEWPKNEIQRVAQTSGKPLEVVCAEAFLANGWKARLGSHFADLSLDTIRELDVLAEREAVSPGPTGITVRVRALVSCRGFPLERSPLMYSVSPSSVPIFEPRLLSSHRVHVKLPGAEHTYGPLDNVERPAAALLMEAGKLEFSRPLVAFDMLERTETVLNKGKPKEELLVNFVRCRDGDKQLFGAIDSSIKAAFFWVQEDYQRQNPIHFAALNVPVCVLSMPFWEVCIDRGKVAVPEISRRGYQSNAYPSRPASKEVMALVWGADEMSDLVKALNELFTWFVTAQLRV